MALRVIRTFGFNGSSHVTYLCEKAGDELPLHDHTFNHITLCENGMIECFTDDGKVVRCERGDAPVEYIAGRKHGIRGVMDGSVFTNVSPGDVVGATH